MRKFIPAFALVCAAVCGYAEPAEQATLAEQEEVTVVEVEEGEAVEAEESEDVAENDEVLIKVKPAKK